MYIYVSSGEIPTEYIVFELDAGLCTDLTIEDHEGVVKVVVLHR